MWNNGAKMAQIDRFLGQLRHLDTCGEGEETTIFETAQENPFFRKSPVKLSHTVAVANSRQGNRILHIYMLHIVARYSMIRIVSNNNGESQ